MSLKIPPTLVSQKIAENFLEMAQSFFMFLRFHESLEGGELMVNSYHHQAGVRNTKASIHPPRHGLSPLASKTMWVFPKMVGKIPPNHAILIGISIINHPFWGTSIFETPM